MKHKGILFIFFILNICTIFAQEKKSITIEVGNKIYSQDDVIEVTINFNNLSPNQGPIKVKHKSTEFEEISNRYGNQIMQRSFNINGSKTTIYSRKAYFKPIKQGTYNLGPVVSIYNGKTYTSNTLKVEIIPIDKLNKTGKKIFIRSILEKKELYLGQKSQLSYYLYINPSLRISQPTLSKAPVIKGFSKEVLKPSSTEQGLQKTYYKNKPFLKLFLFSYILTPTSAGKKTIEGPEISVTLYKKVKKSAIDDPFITGFSNTENKIIKSPPVRIKIKSAPSENQPEEYSGAIGNFKISSSWNKDSLKQGESLNLKIKISGNGNLDYIDNEDLLITFPEEFELYPANKKIKYEDSHKTKGNINWDQVIIPRTPGKYKIPGIKFCYFSPKDKSYKVIQTASHNIIVSKDERSLSAATSPLNRNTSQRTVRYLDQDIHYLKNIAKLYPTNSRFVNYDNFYKYLLFVVLCLVISIIIKLSFKKVSKSNLNNSRKIYNKSLQILKVKIDNPEFNKRLERSILYFVAQKLSLEESELTSDKIQEELQNKKISQKVIEETVSLIQELSFKQFTNIGKNAGKEDLQRTKTLLAKLNKLL